MNLSPRTRHAFAHSQRGAASVAIAFLILMLLGAALATALSLSGSAARDAAMSEEQIEALFLAESGIERAAGRLAGGTPCASLNGDSASLGAGTFSITQASIVGANCQIRVTGTVRGATRTIEAQVTNSGIAGIAFDRVTTRERNNDNSATWTHRVTNANPNPVLIVGVVLKNTGTPAQTVNTVTYNGVALTQIGALSTAVPDVWVELWYRANPPTGANLPVVVTLTGATTAISAGAVSLTGVHQITPIEANAFNQGNPGPASVSVTTVSGNAWVMDVMGKKTDGGVTMTPATGRNIRWNERAGPGGSGGVNRIRSAASTRGPIATPGSVTMDWTFISQPWAMGAVAIKPAAAGQLFSWTEIVN